MIKVKLKRFIAMTMAFCLTILPSNAFATEIDLENSSANVNKHGTVTKDSGSDTFDDETTNVWQGGSITEEVRVNVDVASSFTITIPKEIVLNGNDGSAAYKVKCEGDIAGDQVICVVPDASFTLNEDGGKTTPVTVTQNDTDFTYVELNDAKEYEGLLSAPDISAGNWSGSFYFNINFKASGCEHDYIGVLTKEATETEKGEITYTCSKCGKSYIESVILPVKQSFANMSWQDINTISELGIASDYFNIGDEKEITIGEYVYSTCEHNDNTGKSYQVNRTHSETTYSIQILGFNHDDKSDGSGKAGITVGLKTCMSNTRSLQDSNYISNIGGWKKTSMREYLNNDVYINMPQEIKNIIKTVNKISDDGNRNLITTEDKLFLFSTTEVGVNPNRSVNGQGTKYEYFTDDKALRIKYRNSYTSYWWLRSTCTVNDAYFNYVDNRGYINSSINNLNDGYGPSCYPYCGHGVVFGFCI